MLFLPPFRWGGCCRHARFSTAPECLLARFLSRCALICATAISLPLFAEDLEYNRDVRPILADNCFACHGPDTANRQADLRLDTPDGAYAALSSDAEAVAIKPGNPAHSVVVDRIASTDESLRMPPPEANLTLTKRQIDTIRQWIQQGARYEKHWAFLPPEKPAVPTTQMDPWCANEIDAFILKQMGAHQLAPNPSASREQLLRRVSFDLNGLPPTLAQIEDYLNDQSPDAYAKVIDRLLDSERFGERLAADWLDVARYSDTYGFQVDRDRFVWPWRDWVIRAFNANLPYDQFITQQLAGDLLPDASDDQILATTFCRLHPQEAEGGSIPEEYRTGYVADRIQTVATAFLGLTLECCRCHDHKFDPLTQKEYYQLFAFFDDIDEAGLYSYFTPAIPTPTLLLADDEAKRKMAAQREKIARLEHELKEFAQQRRPGYEAWRDASPQVPATPSGEIAHLDFEEVARPNKAVPGKIGSAAEFTGDDGIPLQVGNFRRSEPFTISLWIRMPDEKERAVVLHRSRAWTDAGSRGYELLIDHGRLNAALVHFDPGNSLRIVTRDKLPLKTWVHVTLSYDGSSRADGLQIFLDGKPAEVEVVRDQLTKEMTGGGGDNITIGERFRDHGLTHGLVDEFRVFSRQLTPLEIRSLSDASALAEAFATSVSVEQPALYEYFLSAVDPDYQSRLSALQKARDEANAFIEDIPEIMVMREMKEPKHAYRLNRGEYNARAEEVFPETPQSLGLLPQEAPRNRLGLARWMTDANHPLTARVIVNHYWQLLFGAGLVRTTEDFGNQGEWPSHPELLDWLARDFIEHGWNVKRLLRQMVLSRTYQQSASVSAEKAAADPGNRWLSRAASYRLSAEMLRDNALAVSGLLIDKVGGPPAKPYEVEVAFKPLPRDQGEGLYRRSLYTYWSRTGPAPAMMTLDAAKRDVCQVRRERTLSPLQPLVLLNGPQFVEAARVLAERVLEEHPDHSDAALVDLFRWTTSRRPTEEELAILRRLYSQHKQDFAAHPSEAKALLAVGDAPCNEKLDAECLAAFTGVANMLLNYDECVFRR